MRSNGRFVEKLAFIIKCVAFDLRRFKTIEILACVPTVSLRHSQPCKRCHARKCLTNCLSVAICGSSLFCFVAPCTRPSIDHPSSIIMSHSKPSKFAKDELTPEGHRVMMLGLDFEKADDKSMFVYIRDELVKEFTPHMLDMRLHPGEVGINPSNRTSGDITATGVRLRGKRVLASGFSYQAIGTPYAFEDHPKKRHIAQHTVLMTERPEFAKYDPDKIKVGSANWTHCNQFCGMVEQGTVCSDPGIPTIDGRIDTHKILSAPGNIRMSEYINRGMNWKVFPYWVAEKYPFMPALFATAGNQEQQVGQGEGCVEVLHKIAKRTSETMKSGKTLRKEDIARAVIRSQPPHAADVPDMVEWVHKWGGGEDMYFVKSIAKFVREMQLSGEVRVSGSHFGALAKLGFGTVMPSHAVSAVVKRLLACEQASDGLATCLSCADIKRLDKRDKDDFLKVDGVIKKNIALMAENRIEPRDVAIQGGWLEMTLIDTILKKPNRDGTLFANIDKVVEEFLLRIFGQAPQIAPPAPGPDSSSTLVKYDEHGAAIGVAKLVLIEQHGFQVGANYHSPKKQWDNGLRTSEPIAWKLISIDGDGKSRLQPYSTIGELLVDQETTISGEELMSKYTKYEKEFKMLVGYPQNEGKHCKEMFAEVFVDRIREALLVKAVAMIDQPLTIRTSPSNSVFAASDIESGALRLSPVTKSITLLDDKKKAAVEPRYQCTLTCPNGSTSLYRMGVPSVSKDFCSAYFVVATTNVQKCANMALQSEMVTFIPASVGKLKIAGNEHNVKIPILVNTSVINKGEELRCYVPKEVKPTTKKEIVLELKAAKKAKVG